MNGTRDTPAGSTRRWNPLTGEWVLLSPGRTNRPWSGAAETGSRPTRPAHAADCYLCPGNTRASGAANPMYEGCFVFDNDYPALAQRPPTVASFAQPLWMREEPTNGMCLVMCYSESHAADLASMPTDDAVDVVQTWVAIDRRLSRQYRWIQIFENRGTAMGASSPHPHCQIWATAHLPTIAARELEHQADYFRQNRSPLLIDYADHESRTGERVVVENEDWVVMVPYWATWPFETIIVPKQPLARLAHLSDRLVATAAGAIQTTARLYDRLFDTEFPYSFGWHSAPGEDSPGWQLHGHFLPPLLRSATVRKHMVGFELLAEAQRDFTPEEAATRLRSSAATRH